MLYHWAGMRQVKSVHAIMLIWTTMGNSKLVFIQPR